MAGRPPSFSPKRTNARVGVTVLPASGRKGPPPKWPLPGRTSADEKRAWADLWASPQAVAWESLGWTRVVARYCRIMVTAETGGLVAKEAWSEARQLEDRLGLTPKAMRLLLWVISDDEVGEKRDEQAQAQSSSSGRRLRAVDDTGT